MIFLQMLIKFMKPSDQCSLEMCINSRKNIQKIHFAKVHNHVISSTQMILKLFVKIVVHPHFQNINDLSFPAVESLTSRTQGSIFDINLNFYFSNSQMQTNRKLLIELHNTLELFRDIFVDDRSITNRIDSAYEKTLMNELSVVPEQYDELILQYFNVIKVFADNINFARLADNLEELNKKGEIPKFKLNTFDMIKAGIDAMSMVKANKLRFINILIKLSPIFKCCDKIIEMPINVLKRCGVIQNEGKKYTDII